MTGKEYEPCPLSRIQITNLLYCKALLITSTALFVKAGFDVDVGRTVDFVKKSRNIHYVKYLDRWP